MGLYWRHAASRRAVSRLSWSHPPRKDSAASARRTTKRIFAKSPAPLETVLKPYRAAIRAATRNTGYNLRNGRNMSLLLE